MKTIHSMIKALSGRGRHLLLATAALLFALVGTSAEATPFGDPTTNDWDCVMTGGGQDGVMFLHFTTDVDPLTGLFTFEGVFALGGSRSNPFSARGGTGSGRTNSVPVGFTNIFAGFTLQGPSSVPNDWTPISSGNRPDWFWNAKGQLVGSFYFPVVFGSVTNTNNVSFVGTVTPMKSLTLLASSPYGNIHFHGIPLVATTAPVTDFNWSGQRTQDGVTMGQIFTMFPTSVPNLFALTGAGPDITYAPGSFCLISSQKRIGFSIYELAGTNFLGTVGTAGRFVSTKNSISFSTVGYSTISTNRIRFSASAVENAP